MPGCVIILPKTVSPKTVSGRLDLSFGIFTRRGEKYCCYAPVFRRRDSACHTRRVGVFHQPRCRRPAPPNLLRTHATCGIRRFFDCRFVGLDGFFGQPETCRDFDGGIIACYGCFIAVFTATCRIFRRRLLAGVAAVLRTADLARPKHRQLRPLNAACRVHRFSDGIRCNRRFEPVARASAFEYGGGDVRIRARQYSFGHGSPERMPSERPCFYSKYRL